MEQHIKNGIEPKLKWLGAQLDDCSRSCVDSHLSWRGGSAPIVNFFGIFDN
jgi:hypothetical protein